MKEPSPSLHAMLLRLREAQARDPLPPWDVRATRLRTLEKMLNEQKDAFAQAIDADFGHRPKEETELLEMYPSLSNLRHSLKRGRRWMRPRGKLANLVFLPLAAKLRAIIFELTLRDELRIEGLTMIAQNKQPRLVERTLVAAGDRAANVVDIRRAA